MAFLTAVGRLKPGVTLTQAEAGLNTIVARIAAAHPELDAAGHRIVITPLASHLSGDARPALWLLLAATGMLLLIAAANIANLSLARATARIRLAGCVRSRTRAAGAAVVDRKFPPRAGRLPIFRASKKSRLI